MSNPRKKKPTARPPSAQYITGAPGPTIQAGAKTWRLGFNTQNAKGRLEELVRAQVVRDALRVRREMPGEEGETYYADACDALKSGHYDTFEKGWFRVLKSSVGSKLFLLSLLQKHHPDATESDALLLITNESEQTEAAIAVVAPDFLYAVARQAATERGAPLQDAERLAAELLAKTREAPEPVTD